MKKLFLFPLTAILLSLSTSSGYAISLTFVPANQNVTQGSPATIRINVSDLNPSPGAPSLGAFDFSVLFDPTILSFTGVTFGGNAGVSDQLQLGAACNPVSGLCGSVPGAGAVEIFELSALSAAALDAGQTDAFTIATLTFNALKGGTSSLAVSGPPGLTLPVFGDALGNPLSLTLGTASVTVSSIVTGVPEPTVWLLVVTGFALLTKVQRRKRRRC